MSEALLRRVARGPVSFWEEYLHNPAENRPEHKLYPWQKEILSWFERKGTRVKASVAAPNGSGKDERVIAALTLWWTLIHERGKVVITSKDSRQLDQQTYPALKKHSEHFGDWRFLDRHIETPTGAKVILFTTDEPGRAEGWHKEDDTDGPLLIIVNEAKSVPDDIYTAFDRCTYNGLLYISSTGLKQGRFYDSHTRLAAQFQRRVVKLDECPHIPKERIDDILATYGREHPFTRSTLFSEFMSQDESNAFVFSHDLVEQNIRSQPPFRSGAKSAFCDFAAGGDENVLAVRIGNEVRIVAAWRERDTMQAIGRFLCEFRKAGLEASEIFADADGIGTVICDRLAEVGWLVNRVFNGGKPYSDRYRNRGAEIWNATAAALFRGDIRLPDDPVLVAQLTTRKLKTESDGRLGLESKADLASRNLPSPDRADAVCGAWACRPFVQELSLFDRWDRAETLGVHPEPPPGMDAGC